MSTPARPPAGAPPGVRIYSARILSAENWMTKDLLLIIASLVVCYGSIIATIAGAAFVGLDHVGTRLSLEEGARMTFKRDANFDYPTALLAIFGIGIVLDILVLGLPLRPISKLQLKWTKKIKIYAILWLGVFCVVCASVRFYYAHLELDAILVAKTQDKATITANAALWARLEPSASIIAACLPTYMPLVRRSTLGSMVKSAATFFSIRSGSRSSASDSSKCHRSKEYTGFHRRWYELRPYHYDYEAKIEAGCRQDHGEPDARGIRTTSEFMVTHQEGS
ncbi:MAG: hypothetical protein Q9216_004868 [Gyalolechia sp. 2 TL-2023]